MRHLKTIRSTFALHFQHKQINVFTRSVGGKTGAQDNRYFDGVDLQYHQYFVIEKILMSKSWSFDPSWGPLLLLQQSCKPQHQQFSPVDHCWELSLLADANQAPIFKPLQLKGDKGEKGWESASTFDPVDEVALGQLHPFNRSSAVFLNLTKYLWQNFLLLPRLSAFLGGCFGHWPIQLRSRLGKKWL